MSTPHPHRVTDVETLERLYGTASGGAIAEEVGHVHPVYRALIEASPFVVLATSGPDGLDASPRGDARGFVVVEDEHTLLLPDRRGNNRVDSLRNIVADPRIALLFLVPGLGETLRVNGRASISIRPDLLERFVIEGKPPRSVIVIAVETVYFQCAKALIRSELRNPDRRVERRSLPSAGTILAALSERRLGGDDYDRAQPERLRETLY
jgi:PPOX class probable FMN-dependent enzyme